MNLLDLPQECILQILHFLKPKHLQALAQTFNKQVLPLCLIELAPVIEKARNKRCMKTLFGQCYPMTVSGDDFNNAELEVEECCFLDNPMDHLEFLELKGNLHWLLPVGDEEGYAAISCGNRIKHAGLEELRRAAKQLNIEEAIPDVFWKLEDNLGYTRNIPSGSGSYFTIGSLLKIDSRILTNLGKQRREGQGQADQVSDENATVAEGNYVFTFYVDEDGQDCGYRYLYLNTNGQHCVLRSGSPLPQGSGHQDEFWLLKEEADLTLSTAEKELNVQNLSFVEAEDLGLEATDLEEWLVNLNYTERARSYFCDDFVLGQMEPGCAKQAMLEEDLKRFLWNVYAKEGREEQLRDL